MMYNRQISLFVNKSEIFQQSVVYDTLSLHCCREKPWNYKRIAWEMHLQHWQLCVCVCVFISWPIVVCFQQIDGEAFLLLTQVDLVKILSIKLGPALKIYNSILMFKTTENSACNELWPAEPRAIITASVQGLVMKIHTVYMTLWRTRFRLGQNEQVEHLW